MAAPPSSGSGLSKARGWWKALLAETAGCRPPCSALTSPQDFGEFSSMTDTTVSPARPRLELTLRAVVLGCVLAVVFTAANTYLGLKIGLTFASAIPAAVISMALLRGLKTSTTCEHITVQTVASARGAMSAIILVLPGLVMAGGWTSFPFSQSVAICILGGRLGVPFSIRRRRALVPGDGLPSPEGRAAAEGLKVGSRGANRGEHAGRQNKQGLLVVTGAAVVAAA